LVDGLRLVLRALCADIVAACAASFGPPTGEPVMKRIAELQPLSHDHHHALVLANRCKKMATSGDITASIALWQEVTQEFIHTLLPHFHIEEQTLIAPLLRLGENQLLKKMLLDHGLIQACVFDTQASETELLQCFGTLLAAHVRFEERELFVAVEDRFTPQEQQRILEFTVSSPSLVSQPIRGISHA
jgi:hemerythrin